ncbi:hypothetical protein ISCGN_020896 [Ixodes scapularis]
MAASMNIPLVSDARKVTEKKAAADAQRQEEAAQKAADAAVFDDQSKCFQLIELVQSYPWLYAKLRRDHKDNPKRENARKEIARLLGIVHYDICRTKWKYLRDKYAKEAGTERSGCGTSDVYKPKWIYFGSLRFLTGTSTVSRRPGFLWVPEGRSAIPRPLGGRAVGGARVAKPCSLLGVGTPTSFLELGGGVCRTTPEVEGDPDGTRRSPEDVCVPVDTIGRAGPLCTASAYEPREANKTRFFASWYGMFSWTFNDTRLREAGAEAVYCLARGAPKGPNIPRAQLNHQGPLFPGHGYATHSQTWVGEPTWLGVRSDATHQAPTKVGAPCVRVWWPTWLGSVVTLLTKHLAPKGTCTANGVHGTQTSSGDLRVPSGSPSASGVVRQTPPPSSRKDVGVPTPSKEQGLATLAPPTALPPKGRGMALRASGTQRKPGLPTKPAASKGQPLVTTTDEPMDQSGLKSDEDSDVTDDVISDDDDDDADAGDVISDVTGDVISDDDDADAGDVISDVTDDVISDDDDDDADAGEVISDVTDDVISDDDDDDADAGDVVSANDVIGEVT